MAKTTKTPSKAQAAPYHTLHIALPPELVARARRLAGNRNLRSLTALIRELLDEATTKKSRKADA